MTHWARTFSEILGRSVRALEPGAHRPRRAVNRRDAFGFFDRSEPSAHERLSRCHGGFYGIPFIFPDCHGPDHDSDFYAEQLQAMIAASPTDKIDVIAHSYSAQELSIVLERYPELKDSIDNFLLLGPTKVRVQAFEGVNVHVVHHAGDPIPSVPHGRGRLGHAADIPGATVRTTTINVDHALGVHDPESFLGTVNNRHDGWFMGGDVGRSMRRELDRTVRELGWK